MPVIAAKITTTLCPLRHSTAAIDPITVWRGHQPHLQVLMTPTSPLLPVAAFLYHRSHIRASRRAQGFVYAV